MSEKLPLQGLRVVVVEDDDDSRELLRMFLELSGAEVRTAVQASAGLFELERSVPDVLLSDLGLPDEDGCSLMRKCRNHPIEAIRLMPAIAVTAMTRRQDVEKTRAAGFDDHLAKPLDLDKLLASITRVRATTRT